MTRFYPNSAHSAENSTPFTYSSLILFPERIRYTCKFDDPNLAGEMQTTITLKKVSCGAEIDIVQEGIPNVIPTDSPSVNAAVTFGLE
jgi:hypothetical protein